MLQWLHPMARPDFKILIMTCERLKKDESRFWFFQSSKSILKWFKWPCVGAQLPAYVETIISIHYSSKQWRAGHRTPIILDCNVMCPAVQRLNYFRRSDITRTSVAWTRTWSEPSISMRKLDGILIHTDTDCSHTPTVKTLLRWVLRVWIYVCVCVSSRARR